MKAAFVSEDRSRCLNLISPYVTVAVIGSLADIAELVEGTGGTRVRAASLTATELGPVCGRH